MIKVADNQGMVLAMVSLKGEIGCYTNLLNTENEEVCGQQECLKGLIKQN